MNYRNRQRGQHFEPWIYDETVAPPPDVILHRNTHTPIYRGELAEAIKAEIRRRSDVMRGRARPVDTHRFTGLVVCMECGNHLALAHRKGSNYQAMCCQQRWRRECGQRHGINVKKIQQYVHEVLEIALKANNLRIIFKDNQSNEEAIERLRKQCEQTRTSMERLIAGLQAVAVDHPSFGVYTGKIDQLGTMLKTQQHELSVLEARQVARSHEQAERTLRTIDLGTFWSLSDQEINQCLHKIFYPNKIFVHEGKIVQVSEYMGRRSPRTRNSI